MRPRAASPLAGGTAWILIAAESRWEVDILNPGVVRNTNKMQSTVLVLQISCNGHDFAGAHDPGVSFHLLQGKRVVGLTAAAADFLTIDQYARDAR